MWVGSVRFALFQIKIMRNLTLLTRFSSNLGEESLQPIKWSTLSVSIEDSRVYAACLARKNESLVIAVMAFEQQNVFQFPVNTAYHQNEISAREVTSWPCETEEIALVGLEYLVDEESLAIALSNGDLLRIFNLSDSQPEVPFQISNLI
jgi:hypothetical protein